MRTFLLIALLFGLTGCGTSTTKTCIECGEDLDSSESGSYCAKCTPDDADSKDSKSGQVASDGTEKHYQAFGRDFLAAKSQAASEGKSIMMLFTGSDWCPPCIALHDTVFVSEEFKTKVPAECVLLVLDNPRDKSAVTGEEQQQYASLSAEFKVEGVPSIFLADAEGKPYHQQVGYGGESPQQWVADLLGQVKK